MIQLARFFFLIVFVCIVSGQSDKCPRCDRLPGNAGTLNYNSSNSTAECWWISTSYKDFHNHALVFQVNNINLNQGVYCRASLQIPNRADNCLYRPGNCILFTECADKAGLKRKLRSAGCNRFYDTEPVDFQCKKVSLAIRDENTEKSISLSYKYFECGDGSVSTAFVPRRSKAFCPRCDRLHGNAGTLNYDSEHADAQCWWISTSYRDFSNHALVFQIQRMNLQGREGTYCRGQLKLPERHSSCHYKPGDCLLYTKCSKLERVKARLQSQGCKRIYSGQRYDFQCQKIELELREFETRKSFSLSYVYVECEPGRTTTSSTTTISTVSTTTTTITYTTISNPTTTRRTLPATTPTPTTTTTTPAPTTTTTTPAPTTTTTTPAPTTTTTTPAPTTTTTTPAPSTTTTTPAPTTTTTTLPSTASTTTSTTTSSSTRTTLPTTTTTTAHTTSSTTTIRSAAATPTNVRALSVKGNGNTTVESPSSTSPSAVGRAKGRNGDIVTKSNERMGNTTDASCMTKPQLGPLIYFIFTALEAKLLGYL